MTRPHKLFSGQVSDFKLRLLRVYRTVVECEGFSAAEPQLGITRSTISKHIGDLENRLCARLCDRGRSGFALTDAGHIVYYATMQLLIAIEEFRSRIIEFHTELVAELSIGLIDCLVTMEETGLRNAVARYGERHPNVHFKVMVGSEGEINQAIRDRRLHVGVTVQRGSSQGIAATPMTMEVSYLYCGRGHEAFDRPDTEISEHDLSRYPMVRHGYSEAESQVIDRWNLSARATSHQTEGVVLPVLSGPFLGFIPDHFAKFREQEGRIRRMMPEKTTKLTKIVATAHRGAKANPIVRQFLPYLSESQEATMQRAASRLVS